jgi:hypothetical protein
LNAPGEIYRLGRNPTRRRELGERRNLSRVTRREKAALLRQLLAEYRGARFEAGGSGGASGMLFVKMPDGKDYFIGGLHNEARGSLAR